MSVYITKIKIKYNLKLSVRVYSLIKSGMEGNHMCKSFIFVQCIIFEVINPTKVYHIYSELVINKHQPHQLGHALEKLDSYNARDQE